MGQHFSDSICEVVGLLHVHCTSLKNIIYTTDNYQLTKARQSLGLKYYSVAKNNFSISNGNNMFPCNFMHFAANDIKGRQVATGNGQLPVATRQVECYNLVSKLSLCFTQLIL